MIIYYVFNNIVCFLSLSINDIGKENFGQRCEHVNDLPCEKMRNKVRNAPSRWSRWWQFSSWLERIKISPSPSTSLCYSYSSSLHPPTPLPPSRWALCFAAILRQSSQSRASPVWLLVGEVAAGDRARGQHDGGRQAEGVVQLLHHGQDDSSCCTGACYLRNCWCSLHRSVSCTFPNKRLVLWLTDARYKPLCTVCCCFVHNPCRICFSFSHFGLGLFYSPF